MNNKGLFFCVMTVCSMIITGDDNIKELVELDSLFAVYQSVVRHALLAWQKVEQGVSDENQIVEVVGRLALVKYFFEQAQEHEKNKISHDSRFWVHVTDHILIHLYQSQVTDEFFLYLQEIIEYIQKRCWGKE